MTRFCPTPCSPRTRSKFGAEPGKPLGFGAIIASGDNNQLLPEELGPGVTEVPCWNSTPWTSLRGLPYGFRKISRMANPKLCSHPNCKCEQFISNCRGTRWRPCLPMVRGPITESQILHHSWRCGLRTNSRHGPAHRNRAAFCYQKSWEGRASEVVSQDLEPLRTRG